MVFLRCIKALTERRMVITKEPILKFSPAWIKRSTCDLNSCADITQKSFSLKFQTTQSKSLPVSGKDLKDSKLYMMYVTFILNGNYMLCVQRRTTDFRKSSFQVAIVCTRQVQQEINKFEGKKLNDFSVCLQNCEKIFELNFTEIYQVEFHQPEKLIVVGVNNSEDYIIRQYRIKATKYDFLLKQEFSLSPTSRKLVIKNKKSIGVLKYLCVEDYSQFVLTSVCSEEQVTCFVYSISSFNCDNRWLICVYDGSASRGEEKLKYLEIRENLVRGRITGVSLLNNQQRLVIVTNTFQMLMYDIQKKRITLKYNRLLSDRPFLLESEEEFIFMQKITQQVDDNGTMQEHLLACSKSGKLYSIPGSYNPAQTQIKCIDIPSSFRNIEDRHLYIEQFLACNFSKQCFLLCQGGLIYTYDLNEHRMSQTYGVHNNNTNDFMDLPIFYYNIINVNYFGNEIYYLKDNTLNIYLSQDLDCEGVQESCKKVALL